MKGMQESSPQADMGIAPCEDGGGVPAGDTLVSCTDNDEQLARELEASMAVSEGGYDSGEWGIPRRVASRPNPCGSLVPQAYTLASYVVSMRRPCGGRG